MDRVLQVSSPINWANVTIGLLIMAVGTYKLVETPSLFYGLFVCVLSVVLALLIFAHDKVLLDSTDDGVIESKLWTLTGIKKYKYQGLANAKAIILIDIGAADAGKSIKSFLLFNDGYRLPIPGDESVRDRITAWFQENYRNKLPVNKE